MKVEIKIPAMGETVFEATISRVIKTSGSIVRRDEEILELETDKVNQVLHLIYNQVKIGILVDIIFIKLLIEQLGML